MKTSPLISALLGVLCSGTFIVFLLAVAYEYSFRQLRTLQTEALAIQNRGVVIKALADDAVEYSKRNAAINPILQKVGVLQGKASLQPSPRSQTK